jgi:hypothetical protein
MQAALLSKPVVRQEAVESIDRLPVGWNQPGLPEGPAHFAVTVGLSRGEGKATGGSAAHREILMRIDLPGDASVHGAGIDVLARQVWVDELQGGAFEHITCRVRHRSATREIDLGWVLRSLRDQGLVADGDLLESIEVTA